VKNPAKLQQKLLQVLRGTPALHVMPNPEAPWNDLDFKEVAFIVQDFVNNNPEVIECDPLREWLDEYRFYAVDKRV
jgi:hypothetical protein